MQPPSTATTDDVALAERLEYWEYWNQRALVGLRCSSPAPDRFHARSTQRALDGSVLTRIQGSQHVVDRSVQRIAAVPKHSVFVNVLLGGTAFLYHAGGLRTLRAGDSFVHTTMTPYLLGFEHDMDLLIVDIDAQLAPEAWSRRTAPSPDIRTTSEASRRLARDGLRVLHDPRSGDDAHERLARHALGVMAGGSEAELARERALGLIRAGLGDPAFSVAALASAMHVSERQLRRWFSDQDRGPGAALLEERLQRARLVLRERADFTMSDVAAACGFGSASAFARAFRARFGASPSEFRDRG